jgi:hypothetical protein
MTREDRMNVANTSVAFLLFAAPCLAEPAHAQADVFKYNRVCDASAAVALDANHFIVANDERNKLQIYKRGQPDPVGSVDLHKFLDTEEKKESDLEGAAAIGNRIYWISSHGRNSEAKVQKRRYRFFATDIKPGATPTVTKVGEEAYTKLLDDLVAADQLKPYNLSAASELAPEAAGGFNIEGLAATPDGKLLIAFRNPRALVVPLENPNDVLDGNKPRFGMPSELDLKGNGIRSIERVGSSYLVIAGPAGDKGSFALYRWSGRQGDAGTRIDGIDFKGLRPEALFAIGDDSVQILSDDGGVKVGNDDCKDLGEAKQSFRSITIKP